MWSIPRPPWPQFSPHGSPPYGHWDKLPPVTTNTPIYLLCSLAQDAQSNWTWLDYSFLGWFQNIFLCVLRLEQFVNVLHHVFGKKFTLNFCAQVLFSTHWVHTRVLSSPLWPQVLSLPCQTCNKIETVWSVLLELKIRWSMAATWQLITNVSTMLWRFRRRQHFCKGCGQILAQEQ